MDIDIKVNKRSVTDLITALEEIKVKVDLATRRATEKSAQYLQARAVANFHGAHPVGWHHEGGNSPNTVTGFLQRSIIYSPITGSGGRYTTHEGPTAIYSRVIELGATITHQEAAYLSWFDAQMGVRRFVKEVTIPPRPYFTPAVTSLAARMPGIFATELEAALNV